MIAHPQWAPGSRYETSISHWATGCDVLVDRARFGSFGLETLNSALPRLPLLNAVRLVCYL
jgi:hypothetical protein